MFVPYLLSVKDCTKGVEELEGGEDVALHEHARHHRRRCPPSCARRHFVPPLLDWQTGQRAVSSNPHDLRHGLRSVLRDMRR